MGKRIAFRLGLIGATIGLAVLGCASQEPIDYQPAGLNSFVLDASGAENAGFNVTTVVQVEGFAQMSASSGMALQLKTNVSSMVAYIYSSSSNAPVSRLPLANHPTRILQSFGSRLVLTAN